MLSLNHFFSSSFCVSSFHQVLESLWKISAFLRYEFVPQEKDVLVATIDFSADTITSLDGLYYTVNGITAGYSGGDVQFFANQISMYFF